jgi:hypothetical protein
MTTNTLREFSQYFKDLIVDGYNIPRIGNRLLLYNGTDFCFKLYLESFFNNWFKSGKLEKDLIGDDLVSRLAFPKKQNIDKLIEFISSNEFQNWYYKICNEYFLEEKNDIKKRTKNSKQIRMNVYKDIKNFIRSLR